MSTTKNNVIGIRLSDDEMEQLDAIMVEDGFTSRAAVGYKAIFEFLRSKRLERKGQRIVYQHIGKPPSDEP
jgi:metal-responsive CopG/Arc/MetJ family transcriptional regulator